MSVGLLAFAAVLVVLDSGGIYSWASRLELGPKRTFALPVAGVLHRGLARLGLEQEREDALVGLARVHWSDDPARMAQAAELAEAERTPIGPPPMPAPPEMSLGSDAAHAAVRVKQQELIRVMEGAPPLVSKLPEIEGVGAGKMRSVALAGDSMMAVGLSPAMLRAAPKYGDLEMLKLFKSGTGLARPEVFDWQQEYPAMLAQARPEFVIVAMGANDAQGFVENGVVYPFGSAGWQAIYQRRVQAYLEMLEADGATVVWLGLPPMRSEEYDAHVALINRIDATVVNASPHAIWFSTAGVVGDQAGKFRDFGEVAGRTARLRQGDGIHLSDDGATLVADKLLPWLAAQALPAGAVPKQ
jgi:hypothetical protein